MRLRLRIQGELSILQIAQFVKRGNKNFYTTLPISGLFTRWGAVCTCSANEANGKARKP